MPLAFVATHSSQDVSHANVNGISQRVGRKTLRGAHKWALRGKLLATGRLFGGSSRKCQKLHFATFADKGTRRALTTRRIRNVAAASDGSVLV